MQKQKRYHLISNEQVVESFDTIPELMDYMQNLYEPDEEDEEDPVLIIAETVKLIDFKVKRIVNLVENTDAKG